MTTGNEGKEKGRSYEQLTRDGTSSAGTMGAGGTGDLGSQQGATPGSKTGSVGGMQSGGRTDDLLSGGAEADQNAQGFASGERPSELQTGMSDLGTRSSSDAGSRQSAEAGDTGKPAANSGGQGGRKGTP